MPRKRFAHIWRCRMSSERTAIQLTTSIGVAVYPIDGREYGELLQRSDFAMFRNKCDMSSRPSIFRLDQTPVNATDGITAGTGLNCWHKKLAPRRGSDAGSQ